MWPEALVSNQVHPPMCLRSQKDFVITGQECIFPLMFESGGEKTANNQM